MNPPASATPAPALERRLGLLPAAALNMANMLGAGPFITISTLIWLYPIPLVLAGVGWTFVYCTLPVSVMLFAAGALLGAGLLYVLWRKGRGSALRTG